MVAGGAAGLAYVTDHLSGLHLLASGDADGGAMGVQRFKPAAVVDAHIVAVSAAPTVEGVGDGHRAACCRQDRAASQCGNVGAAVVAGFAGDGVGAVTKLRCDRAGDRQRPLQAAGRLPIARRGHDLTASGGKPAQQLAPQLGCVIAGELGQVLVLPGVEGVLGAHILGSFVSQLNHQHRLGDGRCGGPAAAVGDLYRLGVGLSAVIHRIHANNYMKDGVLLRQVVNVIDELDLADTEESHAFGAIYESILKELQSAGSSGEFYTPRAVTDFMAQTVDPKIGESIADFACGTGGFLTSALSVLESKKKTADDVNKINNAIYGIEKKQFPYMLCITNMLLHDLDVPKIYHDNSLTRDLLDYTDDDKFDVILMNPPYGGSEKTEVKNHFPADLASSETADLFMAVIMYRLKKNGRAAVILPDGFLFGTDNAKVNLKKKLLNEFNLHTVIRMPGSVFSPYTSITTNILFFDNTHPTEETWFYRLDMPEGYKHFSKTKPMKVEHFAPVAEWWNDRKELTVDGFDKAKKFTAAELAEELGYNFDQCGYPHEEEEILDPLDLIQRYEEQRASLNAEIDRVLAEITDKLGGNKDEQ